MKLEYLWGKLANQLDQILDETSLWRGKDCIRFWDRLDQNSGFHGNRKRPLIYNGENDVSIFLCCFFDRSSTNLLVTRTYQIFNKLAGNQDRHKILEEVEFRPDWISHLGVKRLIMDSPKFSWPFRWKYTGYLVGATPLTVFHQLFWNFLDAFCMMWFGYNPLIIFFSLFLLCELSLFFYMKCYQSV